MFTACFHQWGRQVACALVASIVAPASSQLGGIDVQANLDPPGTVQNEVAMALNPARPGNVLMVYNDHPWSGGVGIGVSYSLNGGATWFDLQLTVPGLPRHFDPMAAADANGTLYAGCIAADNSVPANSGVYVWSSADGGVTWQGPTQVAFDPSGNNTLNDRGHMIVDTNPTSPYLNYVYVTWIKDVGTSGPFSDIWFAAAPPGGANFPVVTMVNDTPGTAMGHAPHIAAASDGTLYCVWTHYDVTISGQTTCRLMFDVSHDGGVTWGPDIWVLNRTFFTVPRVFTDTAGPPGVRGDTAPAIAVHPQLPHEVYVVYPEDTDGPGIGDEGNIICQITGDGGTTWSAPIQVNAGGYAAGQDFAPWITGKPDGTLDVAWYHGGLADNVPVQWGVAVARSTDNGMTWGDPGIINDVVVPAPFDAWMTNRWLGEYLAIVADPTWAYVGFASAINDQFGDVFFDSVNNATFGDCDGDGLPDFLAIMSGLVPDANGNGIPDMCEPWFAEFSIDIGSDSELSDIQADGDDTFDPGDVYYWQGPRVIPPGRDGFKDDAMTFGGDPWPDPPDPTGATRVPIGAGTPQFYNDYLDLDGHDQIDLPLAGMEFPLPFGGSGCIHPPENLLISYDDDMGIGWPVVDVPINAPSPAFQLHGTTAAEDEVVGATVMLLPSSPPYPLAGIYNFASEFQVHQNLAPNPDLGEPDDDDVDSLDVVMQPGMCFVWLFSVDHEGAALLDPGDIYEATFGGGPIPVIDDVAHLGLPDEVDIDAFEFTWLPLPEDPAQPMLALLFSVDDDDPMTFGDESGGLNPNQIYISWLTGFSMPFTDPLEDDVDALTIWLEPLEKGACCYDVTAPACLVSDQATCVMRYNGIWQGPGTDCSDLDGNGVADACEERGACCYGQNPVQCVTTTAQDCTNLLGMYYGQGTDCTDANGDGIADICEPAATCYGDSNCDGVINWRDIDFFVAAQNDNVSGWYAMHMSLLGHPPYCPFRNNDVNADGIANWRDIDPFVALQNTTCP